MSVKMRQEVEQKIMRAAVDSLLASGFRLSVSLEKGFDHETMQENGVFGTRDVEKIMAELVAGDDAHLFVHGADGPLETADGSLETEGWIYFVFGNDGYDVISDYTTGLEKYLTEANKISDQYA